MTNTRRHLVTKPLLLQDCRLLYWSRDSIQMATLYASFTYTSRIIKHLPGNVTGYHGNQQSSRRSGPDTKRHWILLIIRRMQHDDVVHLLKCFNGEGPVLVATVGVVTWSFSVSPVVLVVVGCVVHTLPFISSCGCWDRLWGFLCVLDLMQTIIPTFTQLPNLKL